jgi:hypothetical protein
MTEAEKYEQALNSAHEKCIGDDCQYCEILYNDKQLTQQHLAEMLAFYFQELDPINSTENPLQQVMLVARYKRLLVFVWNEAFHIGYRFCEIETKEKKEVSELKKLYKKKCPDATQKNNL